MKLVMLVGHGPHHTVLHGNPAPPNGKGHSSPPLSKFTNAGFKPRPISIVGKRMDGSGCQLVWRQASSPQPRLHCVRWVPSSPHQKRAQQPPQFSAHVYCGETAEWIKMSLGTEIGLGLREIVFDVDPCYPQKKGHSPQPNFRPMSIVAKRLNGSRRHLVRN